MLKVENLVMKYDQLNVLKGLNFQVQCGEFLAIVGPSGCGKTTLLRIIAGLMKPTEGAISWNHQVINSPTYSVPVHQRSIGMVFQSFALWPHMKASQQVRYALENKRFKHLSEAEKENMVKEALENCGLGAFKDRYPHELSGGQQQRVALARAIVSKPDILLMDEPLSALDAQLRIEMRQEIQRIHKLTGALVVYITHDQSEALSMADHVIVMNAGHVEQHDTPQQVFLNPKSPFVAKFIGKYNLLPGVWHENVFAIKNTNLILDWTEVAQEFVQDNVLPVRPDQFQVVKEHHGIPCQVQLVQYHGDKYYYQLLWQDRIINVTLDLTEFYEIGDRIWILPHNQKQYLKKAVGF